MILTKEKGRRMWGGETTLLGDGGGSSSQSLAGYASMMWVENNYLSKEFFNQLFKVKATVTSTINGQTVTQDIDLLPNDLVDGTTVKLKNVKVEAGLWTEQFLSALGLNSGGGGGGSSTLAGLLDVEISNPANGEGLVYNATSQKWENQPIGGGGTGTLTSIGLTMPTGFTVSPATLTQDGSFNVGFASGYALPTTADVEKGVTAYGWGDHAQAGYVKKRDNGWSYNCIANNHSASVIVKYWRVTLPIDTARWSMLHMEFSLLERYTSGNSGKIIVAGHFGPNLDWSYFCASTVGNLSTNIKVYASDKKYIYIYTNALREVLTLDKVLCEDGIINQDLSGITIDYVSELPQTYQTATMLYGLHSGNVGFGTEAADYIPITLAGTTKNVLTQHQSLSAYLTSAAAADTYLSKTDAASTYLSIAFFARLFQAKNGSENVNPNDTTSTIDNIKAMFGFWTDQYLSALGQNDSGSSGGSLATLVDVALSSPQNGQVLMYNSSTGKWYNGTVQSGGGGTVTSITAGTGLSGGTITTSGTIAINSTYQGYISHGETAYGWGNHATAGYLTSQNLVGYATQSWVNQQGFLKSVAFSELTSHPTTLSGYGITDAYTKTEADAKFMTIAAFENLFNAIGSDGSTKINHPYASGVASIKAMVGLWTEQYLSALGLNPGGGGGGATTLAGLLDVEISNPANGEGLVYNATSQKWENQPIGGGGVILNEPLASINTAGLGAPSQSGVAIMWNGSAWTYQVPGGGGGGGGTVTSVGVSVPTGFVVSGSPVTGSGTINIGFGSGYALPTTADVEKGVTAYGWGNHANAGYASSQSVSTLQGYFSSGNAKSALKLTTVSKTAWGKTYWTAGGVPDNVDGNISAGNSGGVIEKFHAIELNNAGSLSSYGGLVDFHYNGSASDYTTRMIEEAAGVVSIYGKNSASPYADKLVGVKVGSNVTGASYLQIGAVRLVYDHANTALKVEKQDGTAANLYATGGVSALGMMATDSGMLENLNLTGRLKFIDVENEYEHQIYGDTDGYLHINASEGIELNSDLNLNGYTLYMTGGNIDANYVSGKRFYLGSTRYLYLDANNVLKYYDNGTIRTIAFA